MGQARIKVRISADGMSALVSVVAGPAFAEAAIGGAALSVALQAAGVVFGIDDSACAALAAQLMDELFTVEGVRVAEGAPKVAATDGFFVPSYTSGIQPGHLREDGTMDFLDRELLTPVAEGAELGRVHPARAGVPGRRVDGAELPVDKPRELGLAFGPGVSLRDDGQVVAARSGVILDHVGKSLDVVQHHVHAGKVDLRSGHLDMEGSLVVRGSVERLFRVNASGDIQVQSGVEYGSVHAGGSVRVTGGIRGGETGMISAEADVAARHAEYAHVICGGTLTLENAVNSQLMAHDIVIKGKLRGGKASAEHGLIAREAGVAQGVATALAAGIPIERPILNAKRAVEVAKEQRQVTHKTGLRGDLRGKGGKLGRTAAALVSAELERKLSLAKQREEAVHSASIQITGIVHAGVTIQLGIMTLPIEQATSSVRFSFDAATRQIRTERFVL